MHCFILGVTGFLGSHVADGLLARGDQVSGLTSSPGKTDSLEKRGITPVVGDMRKPEAWISKAADADAVVQAAMLPLPNRPSKHYVKRTIEAEIKLLTQLLPALGDSVRFLYTSGTGIYGDGSVVCREKYPTNPLSRSRKDVVAERFILESVRSRGTRATILRPAPIYGPGGIFHMFWGERLAKGKRVIYPGKGNQKWSFVSVWDCARAYLLALDGEGAGEIYNVADDQPATIREFLYRLAEELEAPEPLGIPKPVFRMMAGPVYAQAMFSSFMADNRRIKDELGFRPAHPTFREGTRALAQAYRGHKPPVLEQGRSANA